MDVEVRRTNAIKDQVEKDEGDISSVSEPEVRTSPQYLLWLPPFFWASGVAL